MTKVERVFLVIITVLAIGAFVFLERYKGNGWKIGHRFGEG